MYQGVDTSAQEALSSQRGNQELFLPAIMPPADLVSIFGGEIEVYWKDVYRKPRPSPIQEMIERRADLVGFDGGEIIARTPDILGQLRQVLPYDDIQLSQIRDGFHNLRHAGSTTDLATIRNYRKKKGERHNLEIYKQIFGEAMRWIFEDPQEILPALSASVSTGRMILSPVVLYRYPIIAREYRGEKNKPLSGYIYHAVYVNVGEKFSKGGIRVIGTTKAVKTWRIWDEESETLLQQLEYERDWYSSHKYGKPPPRKQEGRDPSYIIEPEPIIPEIVDGVIRAPFRSYSFRDPSRISNRQDKSAFKEDYRKGQIFEQLVVLTRLYLHAWAEGDSRVYQQFRIDDGYSSISTRADYACFDSGLLEVGEVKYGRAIGNIRETLDRHSIQLAQPWNTGYRYTLITLTPDASGFHYNNDEFSYTHQTYEQFIEPIHDEEMKNYFGYLGGLIYTLAEGGESMSQMVQGRFRTFLYNLIDQANCVTGLDRQEYIKRALGEFVNLHKQGSKDDLYTCMEKYTVYPYDSREMTYRLDGKIFWGRI